MKNSIGTYLILGAIIFVIAFFLGRYSKSKEEIFMGQSPKLEELHQENKKEESRIDSLETINHKIDLDINKIHKKKSFITKKYVQDTININNASWDSLIILFSRKYPRTPYKQVSDSISIKR